MKSFYAVAFVIAAIGIPHRTVQTEMRPDVNHCSCCRHPVTHLCKKCGLALCEFHRECPECETDELIPLWRAKLHLHGWLWISRENTQVPFRR
jgi:hypothetical protein